MIVHAAFRNFVEQLTRVHEPAEARSIARIVMEDALGVHPMDRKRELKPGEQKRLEEITRRLLGGEPIQYVLGQADFYGMKFKVDRSVLIPRQETEELVHWVASTFRREWGGRPARVLDIGTGSGCIPIALKHEAANLSICGIDISDEALATARENARLNGVKGEWKKLNILEESSWGQLDFFDFIVSNPPYIPQRESEIVPEQVKGQEPSLALFVNDEDPLIFYRKIAEFARLHLVERGFLFFETNEFNAREVVRLLKKLGFKAVELRKDLAGKDRMVKGIFMGMPTEDNENEAADSSSADDIREGGGAS